jgi:nucleoid-associated protein YgaU
MSFLDFARDIGAKLFSTDGEAARRIKEHLDVSLTDASKITVEFDDGVVTLAGACDSQRTKELAVLLAGNVKGVNRVVADSLIPVAAAAPPLAATPATKPAANAAASPAVERTEYYEIKRGDTLSAIAKQYYGKASAYTKIFEANRELIKDPDKIYPGQKIRIPLGD